MSVVLHDPSALNEGSVLILPPGCVMVARAASWAYVAPPNVVKVLVLIDGSFTTGGLPFTSPAPLVPTVPPLSRTPAWAGPGGSQLAHPVGIWSEPSISALPPTLTPPW